MRIKSILGFVKNNFFVIVNWLTGIWAFGIGIRLTYQLLNYGNFLVKGYLWLDWIPLTFLGVVTASDSLGKMINYFKGGENDG